MKIELKAESEAQFLSKYLEFYNLLVLPEQRLNPSEIDLIIEFALLPPKFEYQRFGSLAKTKVIESTAARNWHLTKLNINNKLYALLDKKYLKRDIDKVIYLPKHIQQALSSFRKEKLYTINVVFDGTNQNNADNTENS